MAKKEKPLSNSVAGEVNYSSTTGEATCKLKINFGKGMAQDKVRKQIEDLLSRYGGVEDINFKYEKG